MKIDSFIDSFIKCKRESGKGQTLHSHFNIPTAFKWHKIYVYIGPCHFFPSQKKNLLNIVFFLDSKSLLNPKKMWVRVNLSMKLLHRKSWFTAEKVKKWSTAMIDSNEFQRHVREKGEQCRYVRFVCCFRSKSHEFSNDRASPYAALQ